jgi:predicted nucleotidyltransferase
MSDTIFMIDYKKLRPAVERVCRELPVKRLGLFGSVLTQEFGPQSDVDVLVVFDADVEVDLFEKYFEVDLMVDRPFRNPIFRESVEKTRTIIYER